MGQSKVVLHHTTTLLLSLFGIALVSLSSSPTHAQEDQRRLAVELERCTQLDQERLQRFVRVETGIATRVAPSGSLSAGKDDVRILVRCLPKKALEVLLVPRGAKPSKTRTVTPKGEREVEWFLALAIVELIDEQARAQIEPEPDQAKDPPKEEVTKSPEATSSTSAYSVGAHAVGVYLADLGGAAGGGIDLLRAKPGSLAIGVQGMFVGGDKEVGEATVSHNVGSLSASLGWQWGTSWRIGLAAGVRGGWVSWRGEGSGAQEQGETVPWGGPLARSWVHLRLGDHVGLGAQFEGGVPLATAVVTRGDEVLVGIQDFWVLSSLSLRVWF